MTDQTPKHDMPGGDRSEFCPTCDQPYFLEDCTKTQCNSRGESPYCDNRDDDEPGHNQFGEAGYWAGTAQ